MTFQNPTCLLELSDFNRLSGEKMLKSILIIVYFSLIAWLSTVTRQLLITQDKVLPVQAMKTCGWWSYTSTHSEPRH
jgi:hypothetical protein